MAKIRLDVDALAVDSFVTAEAGSAKGTVRARSDFGYEGDIGEVAITATIAETCPATCRFTCPASCDTCYASCVTACSCRTQPCDTCA
ncbi:MAG TPA: hypothetical protein VFJ82_01215 [Longimicrobium sp.]|nr:hypothetical protein [Longimicrobium sp.]